NTTKLALSYSKRLGAEKLRVITLKRNRGKGGAVRLGFWAARGRRLLFADADGATRFSDFDKLDEKMDEISSIRTAMQKDVDFQLEENEAIVVGSRAHMEKESIVERSLFRTVLMFGFHFLVWLFCVKTIRDTQCGFKLFTRSSVRVLFWNLHIERWAFDVELLFLAEKLKIPINEVPVTWHEVAGSKLTPLAASCEMARDLFMIWFRYFTCIWTIDLKAKDYGVE
uniref:dolichyl-phosphate beta-glucosyltransferase n=1 Tax=Romanomermis culicivorax TaxID=13658 RepID=A0A915IS51_ROMCU